MDDIGCRNAATLAVVVGNGDAQRIVVIDDNRQIAGAQGFDRAIKRR